MFVLISKNGHRRVIGVVCFECPFTAPKRHVVWFVSFREMLFGSRHQKEVIDCCFVLQHKKRCD
jgi:hypothetical protein